jgi:hypothetical protein
MTIKNTLRKIVGTTLTGLALAGCGSQTIERERFGYTSPFDPANIRGETGIRFIDRRNSSTPTTYEDLDKQAYGNKTGDGNLDEKRICDSQGNTLVVIKLGDVDHSTAIDYNSYSVQIGSNEHLIPRDSPEGRELQREFESVKTLYDSTQNRGSH